MPASTVYRSDTGDSLDKDAAAVGLSVHEFLRAVDQDWAELGVLYPGHLPRAWRTARLMYTVTHPVTGWWVALDTPESIAAIRAELGDRLVLGGVTGIDLSLLHGRDRLNTIENPCAPTPAPGSPRGTPTC